MVHGPFFGEKKLPLAIFTIPLATRKLTPNCQMMLFSATYDEKVMRFAMKIIADPVTIRLKREEESLDNIKQYYVLCSTRDEKFQALSNIYGVLSIGQAIIFCQVRTLAMYSGICPCKIGPEKLV